LRRILIGLLVFIIILFSSYGAKYSVCSSGCDFLNITAGLENITGTTDSLELNESGTYSVTNIMTFIAIDHNDDGVVYINEEDITLDCNLINLTGNNSGYGIYIEDKNNITVRNCNVNNYSIGIYYENSSDSYLLNNSIGFCDYGIRLSETDNTIIKYNLMSNISTRAVQFTNTAINNTLWNSQIISSTSDIESSGENTSNLVLNTSFDNSKLNFNNNALLYVKWFFRAFVNDSNSNNISSVIVNITDSFSTLTYSLTTAASGYTTEKNITEYIENSSGRMHYTNYSFYAYNSTRFATRSVNITSSGIVVLTFDLIPASITISNPVNNTNLSNSTTWVNATITTDEFADCSYNLSNSGFDYVNEGAAMSDSGDGLAHWFNYTGLENGTTYTIYYKCNDSNGNINTESTYHVFHVNQTPTESIPPVITISNPVNNTNLSNSTTWVNATITTDEFADCSYNLSNSGFDYVNEGAAMSDSGDGLSHWFNYTGLENGTNYSIYYKCNDTNGNINTNSAYHVFHVNQTLIESIPPIITISYPSNDSNLSYTTTWTWVNITTDETADCKYNLTDSAFNFTTQGTLFTSTGTTAHSFNYSGLWNGTTYTLYYKCNDTVGNINPSSLYHVFYTNTAPDLTPPVISNQQNSTVNQSMAISFDTDDSANFTLDYGTSATVLSSSSSNPTFTTSHSTNLSSLISNTTYYFNITSCNYDGYCAEYGVFSITTDVTPDVTAPIITGIANSSIAVSSAVITWTTDEISDSMVKYGTASGTYSSSTTNTTNTTSHSITLTGLSEDTTYYYVVNSTDTSGNPAQSAEYSFATPDVTAPVISSVASGSIIGGSATITWTTDEAADSQVSYGTASGTYTLSVSSSSFVTSHSRGLSGLSSDTTYYYRVVSNDSSGNSRQSSESSFSTSDVAAPVISITYPINMSTVLTDSINVQLTATT